MAATGGGAAGGNSGVAGQSGGSGAAAGGLGGVAGQAGGSAGQAGQATDVKMPKFPGKHCDEIRLSENPYAPHPNNHGNVITNHGTVVGGRLRLGNPEGASSDSIVVRVWDIGPTEEVVSTTSNILWLNGASPDAVVFGLDDQWLMQIGVQTQSTPPAVQRYVVGGKIGGQAWSKQLGPGVDYAYAAFNGEKVTLVSPAGTVREMDWDGTLGPAYDFQPPPMKWSPAFGTGFYVTPTSGVTYGWVSTNTGLMVTALRRDGTTPPGLGAQRWVMLDGYASLLPAGSILAAHLSRVVGGPGGAMAVFAVDSSTWDGAIWMQAMDADGAAKPGFLVHAPTYGFKRLTVDLTGTATGNDNYVLASSNGSLMVHYATSTQLLSSRRILDSIPADCMYGTPNCRPDLTHDPVLGPGSAKNPAVDHDLTSADHLPLFLTSVTWDGSAWIGFDDADHLSVPWVNAYRYVRDDGECLVESLGSIALRAKYGTEP